MPGMMRLGKRGLMKLRLGKRSLPSMRLGKKSAITSLRLRKRSGMTSVSLRRGPPAKWSFMTPQMEKLLKNPEFRQELKNLMTNKAFRDHLMNMKSPQSETHSKRSLPGMRLGKRALPSMRLGKRSEIDDPDYLMEDYDLGSEQEEEEY